MSTRGEARRQPFSGWTGGARRALPSLCLLGPLLALGVAGTPVQAGVSAAAFEAPTDRYTHGILGDAIEWGALAMTTDDGRSLRITLPDTHVFEDVAPRLIDVDLDGDAEVVVVETFIPQGARLAIYDEAGLVAATPYIGRTNRWLAPLGGADLDGDGYVELAYIDRPHLAKTLMIWRFRDGALHKLAERGGLTNHRIGEADIAGGIRTCDGVEMIVTADAGWTRLVGATFDGTSIETKDLGPHKGRASFARALEC